MPIQGISLAGCWHLVQYIQQQHGSVMLAHYQTPPKYLLVGYGIIETGAWFALWKPAWHFLLTQLQLQGFIWAVLQNVVLCQFLISFLLKNLKEGASILSLIPTCLNKKGHIQLLSYNVSDFRGLRYPGWHSMGTWSALTNTLSPVFSCHTSNGKTCISGSYMVILEENSSSPLLKNVLTMITWPVTALFPLFGYFSCPTKSEIPGPPNEHTFKAWNKPTWWSLRKLFCRTEISFLGLLIFVLSNPLKSSLPCCLLGYLRASFRAFSLPSSENFRTGRCRATFSSVALHSVFSSLSLVWAAISTFSCSWNTPCNSHPLQVLFVVLLTATTIMTYQNQTHADFIKLDFVLLFAFLKLQESDFQVCFYRYESKQSTSFF